MQPYDHIIDTAGLVCPEPLMIARNTMRQMATGEVLCIEATDPSTERDFTQFCHFLGHALLASEQTADLYRYWIRKDG